MIQIIETSDGNTALLFGTDQGVYGGFTESIQGFLEEDFVSNDRSGELTNLMDHYGSDKGNRHNYTEIYEFLLSHRRYEALNIFEVGLGTLDPTVPSNMSEIPGSQPGASLRGWRDFFPNAQVYGADIDANILFTEDRIQTFYVDQLSHYKIRDMWSKIGDKLFDLIVDDGLHTYEANSTFLEHSLSHVKKGGYYVIEDIHHSIARCYVNYLEVRGLTGVVVFIPSEIYNTTWPDINSYGDNVLCIIRKD